MQDITGTIIKIKDFLFNIETEVIIKYNNESFPVLKFEKDRVLSIPDYQREIRWEKENLFALMNDISNGAKFLGNIILSSVNNKTFLIIDGQQRLILLNMLVNYIKHRYGDEIDDIGDLVEIKLNCFDKFRQYQECHYSLSEVDASIKTEILSSDKFKQTKSLDPLYQFISTSKFLDTPDKARKFLEKLKHCKVNVIVADEEDVKTSTEYYIDVNLKGIKLDTEDIFKGYLLSHDSSIQIRQDWVELKKAWINFNENLSTFKADNAYPLTKILEHYIYWLHFFFDKAEKVSNKSMQLIWARLLAGEFNQPGSISRKLMHIISIMDVHSARSFRTFSYYVLERKGLFTTNYDTDAVLIPAGFHVDSFDFLIKTEKWLNSAGFDNYKELALDLTMNTGELNSLENLGLVQRVPDSDCALALIYHTEDFEAYCLTPQNDMSFPLGVYSFTTEGQQLYSIIGCTGCKGVFEIIKQYLLECKIDFRVDGDEL